MRQMCGEILQETCHVLKEEYDIGATFYLIGSGKRKLILQNANEPIDLDYNLEIVRCENIKDCRKIKECVKKSFNAVLKNEGLLDCEDSTSVLTSKPMHFSSNQKTSFSIDIAIIRKSDQRIYRLIHKKTGWRNLDEYYWNEAPHSLNIRKKENLIKKKRQWMKVREEYLRLKNHYLQLNDQNHPSFICYIEAVNNVSNAIQTR